MNTFSSVLVNHYPTCVHATKTKACIYVWEQDGIKAKKKLLQISAIHVVSSINHLGLKLATAVPLFVSLEDFSWIKQTFRKGGFPTRWHISTASCV